MGKLNSRTIAVILLVVWSSLVCAGHRSPQHRGVGANSSDPGEIVFFILYVLIGEFGKKLDKSYRCPVYCEVKHNHIYWEKDETKEGNIQTDDGLPGSDESEDREQQKSIIRPIASIH